MHSDSTPAHSESVERSFGPRANAYLSSAVHAQGEDLAALRSLVASTPEAHVLDLGCGAGHVSFAVAPVAAEVTACDLTPTMLETVQAAARERALSNIATRQASAEQLPFADASFDWVLSRYSAHHWRNVPQALAEVRRVLRPAGRVCFIDVVGSADPLFDTHLQAVELLRDPSHVRNYSAQEWLTLFAAAGLPAQVTHEWRLPLEFASWVARIGTPEPRIAAIRTLWAAAPAEVREHYALAPDGSFQLAVARIEAIPALLPLQLSSL
ncbi:MULTISPECIES: class I SAM-dependent methyltransferase [Acidobacterium]|uniref:Methyltransferase, UbiE/COQ5 family protein n=1 Tax=Acidobacterium capsulatum (strain ATCC 51196 / DSM 11244 / BCRC 80197 / JCM 7670 / NBRC 15755 / NCIMB 13165 / 161) TaxID=240015 RepID=C1FA49_ACIC5|nr:MULTISPECIES: class I SAM-dependent methyltransferase [Acidobacterium]ACO33491.1 methyltransferase, UbiE/COQ5 family protein [Acidobacterium capsulatum ATCC 51196]HCT62284.1 class I SAM-dependent methyltransferase [Acidobacterium sp.]